MLEIYHNSSCSKSREGLQILESSGKTFNVVKYIDEPLSFENLQHIIELLKIKPIQLIRKNEAIWKANFKDKKLSDQELIHLMIKHPKLMERPIVIHDGKAVIGRPPTKILEIL
ncbi:arsenate reductase (glutaredoxin) [Flavobacteriaceae bacterium LMO-SS05]